MPRKPLAERGTYHHTEGLPAARELQAPTVPFGAISAIQHQFAASLQLDALSALQLAAW